MTQNGNGITQENLERLTLQERLAEANGFSLAPPVYALGTPVVQVGRDNFRKSRQEFEALPPAREVFRPFLNRVAAEERRDMSAPVNTIEMLPTGELQRYGGSPLKLSGAASLRQLLARTDCEEPGAAATYLALVPPARRAAEVNEWLRKTDDDKVAVFRTRNAIALDNQTPTILGREVFAIVSERYGTGLEADVLGRGILAALERDLLPGDARGQVTYDGNRVTISALWHSNIQPAQVCAGEVFKAGMSISTSDDGTQALSASCDLLRNLCLNLIILAMAKQDMGTKRHVGTAHELQSWLHAAMRAASAKVRDFANLWDSGRTQDLRTITRDIPAELPAHVSPERAIAQGVFRGLLKQGTISIPGHRREDAIQLLTMAYDKEREMNFNRVGIVNAITRAAHENTQRSVWVSEEMETAAGTILRSTRPFQYVAAGDTATV